VHRPATQGTLRGSTSFSSTWRPCPTVVVTLVRVLGLWPQSTALAQLLAPRSVVRLVEHVLRSFIQVDPGGWPTLGRGRQQEQERERAWARSAWYLHRPCQCRHPQLFVDELVTDFQSLCEYTHLSPFPFPFKSSAEVIPRNCLHWSITSSSFFFMLILFSPSSSALDPRPLDHTVPCLSRNGSMPSSHSPVPNTHA
jgi:hypothetical protein